MSPYYKVVDRCNGAWRSVFARDPGWWQMRVDTEIKYLPYEWAKAHQFMAQLGYHPTAFGHLDYAKRFVDSVAHNVALEIWRCRIRNRVWRLPPMLCLEPLWRWEKVVETTGKWPQGTMMAKQIMLTERVE